MRITIDKGYRPLITKVMQELGVDDPRLALNHILGTYAASQNSSLLGASAPVPTSTADIDDEFSVLTDWS